MSEIMMKIIPSYEKCFIDEKIDTKDEIKSGYALKGETYSFGVALTDTDKKAVSRQTLNIKIKSDIYDQIRISRVDSVPVQFPVPLAGKDRDYLRTRPGLYPDLLVPMIEEDEIYVVKGKLTSLWVDVEVSEKVAPGKHVIDLLMYDQKKEEVGKQRFTLKVIDAVLPEQKIKVTQWFHADCLADIYGVPIFSDDHWRIIGNFMYTAARNGINMILTPIFTPPLDTAKGYERPTVQLIDVKRNGGRYSFGFEKFERWVKLAKSRGIKYFEFSHLFTQWGAKHAPKIMATVDGSANTEMIFGPDTDALGDEYRKFLHSFLSRLKKEMKKLEIEDKCVFHVSDEPGDNMLESYSAAKNIISKDLDGQEVIDALSDIKFYETGAVDTPVVSTDHIEPFIKAGVDPLWAYYCCCQTEKVSNRLISMSMARNRVIGIQLYKYGISGFLQWGYNFYYTQGSTRLIDPFLCNDGGYWVPAGDAFSVYPAQDGTAYESLHLRGFTQALYDIRAMELAESLCGKEKVCKEFESKSEPLTFSSYPKDRDFPERIREKINRLIERNL